MIGSVRLDSRGRCNVYTRANLSIPLLPPTRGVRTRVISSNSNTTSKGHCPYQNKHGRSKITSKVGRSQQSKFNKFHITNVSESSRPQGRIFEIVCMTKDDLVELNSLNQDQKSRSRICRIHLLLLRCGECSRYYEK